MAVEQERISRLEAIFDTIVKLDKLYFEAESLNEYMMQAHLLLAELMFAKNLYLAAYNDSDSTIQYLYNVDEKDETIPPEQKFRLATPEQSPTAWVIVNRQKLIITSDNEPSFKGDNEYWGEGSQSYFWLGLPLIAKKNQCLGALVVQSYDSEISLNEEEQSIFQIFTSIVASAIEKHSQSTELKSSLEDKTLALAKELEERRRAEQVQHALYEITSLATQAPNLDILYEQTHQIIGRLIYAKNFYIALLDEDSNEICLSYFVDEKEGDSVQGTILPVGKGMTSFVIKTRKPQILTPGRVDELVAKGEVTGIIGANDFTSWLGVPMISSNILHGILVVQSYDEKIIYTQSEADLLNFVANHVAKAIESTINIQQRKEAQLKLAKQHRILEQQHSELKETLATLKRTQQELVQQEKMASLGGLVAGIAHEINTPLGICVTGVSHLMEEYKLVNSAFEQQSLSEEQLVDFFDEVEQGCKILDSNTQRAAELVKSFKQVAVDQSSNTVREIYFKQYIEEVLLSLRPKLKRIKHNIVVNCDENIIAEANAGAISQILSNLIMNSIKHGFDGIAQGNIAIFVEHKKGFIILRYADDGNGLAQEAMKQLFEPFYTTKRGSGGSGLGTHLVYNLVTSALNGRIEAKSEPGKGLAYLIKFPDAAA